MSPEQIYYKKEEFNFPHQDRVSCFLVAFAQQILDPSSNELVYNGMEVAIRHIPAIIAGSDYKMEDTVRKYIRDFLNDEETGIEGLGSLELTTELKKEFIRMGGGLNNHAKELLAKLITTDPC